MLEPLFETIRDPARRCFPQQHHLASLRDRTAPFAMSRLDGPKWLRNVPQGCAIPDAERQRTCLVLPLSREVNVCIVFAPHDWNHAKGLGLQLHTFSGFGYPSYAFGQVCLNNGHGVFRKGPGAPYGASAFVDVNGDGFGDWVSGPMCVLGQCYPSTGGHIFVEDFDGDGTPEFLTSGGELHKINCLP
jgi:hypothetical protein